jgi:1-acyl-sn-glycerol-3-phosphate acyltransferase
MAPPLIAAGDNLSFFPLGPVLRHSGAFFIKRSFKGKKLYPQLVDAYIRKILVEGWNVEVFVEGGRSRTGKMLPPKLGILTMIVDAALKLRGHKEIRFVPISIGYERIVEEGSYVAESEGGDKQPENLQSLLRTPRVLRSRYGRLYLQFGEILSFDEAYAETTALGSEKHGAPAEPAHELTPPERRALVQRIAHRVTYEINRVTMVTPAALAATVADDPSRKRGIARKDLRARAEVLVAGLSSPRRARRADPREIAPASCEPETLDDGASRSSSTAKLVTIDRQGAEQDASSASRSTRSASASRSSTSRTTCSTSSCPSALVLERPRCARLGGAHERAARVRCASSHASSSWSSSTAPTHPSRRSSRTRSAVMMRGRRDRDLGRDDTGRARGAARGPAATAARARCLRGDDPHLPRGVRASRSTRP